jgi:hypothetical protein
VEVVFSGIDILLAREYVETWYVEYRLLQRIALAAIVRADVRCLIDSDAITRGTGLNRKRARQGREHPDSGGLLGRKIIHRDASGPG